MTLQLNDYFQLVEDLGFTAESLKRVLQKIDKLVVDLRLFEDIKEIAEQIIAEEFIIGE